MKRTDTVIGFAFALLIVAHPICAEAQFGSFFGGDSSSDSSGGEQMYVDSLVDQNNNIVNRYQSALVNLLKAQDILKEALGISAESQLAEGTAERLAGGAVEKDLLERATAETQQNDELINAKIAEGAQLDEESKAKYATALPYYANGTLDGYFIIPEASAYASSVSSSLAGMSSNPLEALNLIKLRNGAASGIYVASELPGLIRQWANNTTTLITFGQENDVDVSEAEKTMGEIEL